jgi:CRISPR-associated protein, csy4 family
MKYYQEITLIKQFDVSVYVVWSVLYKQLHIALVKIKETDEKVSIGFSFPEYCYQEKTEGGPANIGLGTKLRVFANSEAELQRLDLRSILGLSDYIHLSQVRAVPQKRITGYAVYKRVQPKTRNTARRLLKRYIKRKEEEGVIIIEAEQEARMKHYQSSLIGLPYVHISSDSTSAGKNKNYFRLFIKREERENPLERGRFTTYGLSDLSTVPEF